MKIWGEPVEKYQKPIESIRRWHRLVIGAGLVGMVLAALIALGGSTTYSSTATIVVGTAATQGPSLQAPEQDAVLARAYVEVINTADQSAVREAADIDDGVAVAAAPIANSPLVAITATADDAETAVAAADAFAEGFVSETEATFNRIITGRLAPLRARHRQLAAEIAGLEQRVNEGGLSAARTAVLRAELTAARAELAGLEAQIQQQSGTAANPNLAGLYQPAGPASSAGPSVVRNAVLGLIGGLIVGLAIALILGGLELRIRTPADVRNRLGLATLGTVPAPEADGEDAAYRAIADAIAITRPPVRTLMVAGAGSGEPAAAVAQRIAMERAEQGDRVILIDADARQLTAASRTGSSQAVRGLSDLLADGAERSLARLLRAGDHERLRVLGPGRHPASARNVLSTDRLQAVIDEAAELADLVVIAGPPLLLAAESRLLSGAADSTILVVDTGATPPREALEARDLLSESGAALVGVVLSDQAGPSPLRR